MRANRLHPLSTIGLLLLALANVTTYVLSRHTTASEDLVDPVAGFLFGIAISTLLIGIVRQKRRHDTEQDRCA